VGFESQSGSYTFGVAAPVAMPIAGERLALGSRMKHQPTHTDESALQL
jgi:hypothetical protein